MILSFPAAKVRHEIHEQRRKDLADRIKIRQMARAFESAPERQSREDLEQLRNQDWK